MGELMGLRASLPKVQPGVRVQQRLRRMLEQGLGRPIRLRG